jgi:hypothetical protein
MGPKKFSAVASVETVGRGGGGECAGHWRGSAGLLFLPLRWGVIESGGKRRRGALFLFCAPVDVDEQRRLILRTRERAHKTVKVRPYDGSGETPGLPTAFNYTPSLVLLKTSENRQKIFI